MPTPTGEVSVSSPYLCVGSFIQHLVCKGCWNSPSDLFNTQNGELGKWLKNRNLNVPCSASFPLSSPTLQHSMPFWVPNPLKLCLHFSPLASLSSPRDSLSQEPTHISVLSETFSPGLPGCFYSSSPAPARDQEPVYSNGEYCC